MLRLCGEEVEDMLKVMRIMRTDKEHEEKHTKRIESQ
jgi:hypothetical protein